jgi:hypothetical protein
MMIGIINNYWKNVEKSILEATNAMIQPQGEKT